MDKDKVNVWFGRKRKISADSAISDFFVCFTKIQVCSILAESTQATN